MDTSQEKRFTQLLDASARDMFASGDSSADLIASIKRLFTQYMLFDGKTSFMGVYVNRRDVLALGPYIGPPTIHDLIPISRGVVGRCADTKEPLIISDVSCCDYYLSCCEDVRSEIVVPIVDA